MNKILRNIIYLISIFIIVSCKHDIKNKRFVTKSKSSKNIEFKTVNSIEKELKLANGIKIKFSKKGSGDKIKKYDVIKIDYKVRLKDGTVVDGNHLLKKEFLPFIVGFTMQTPGWDLALLEMNVGDEAEIYLPAKMARGENGIKGLIPPNSDNYINIKILGRLQANKNIDGTKIWLLEENKSEKIKANINNIIEFHYMVSTPTNPRYDISYRKSSPYIFKFSDFGIIKGLKNALLGVKKSDKIWVFVPPEQAYGNKGLLDLIKPNEPVFYDIFVMDVR